MNGSISATDQIPSRSQRRPSTEYKTHPRLESSWRVSLAEPAPSYITRLVCLNLLYGIRNVRGGYTEYARPRNLRPAVYRVFYVYARNIRAHVQRDNKRAREGGCVEEHRCSFTTTAIVDLRRVVNDVPCSAGAASTSRLFTINFARQSRRVTALKRTGISAVF